MSDNTTQIQKNFVNAIKALQQDVGDLQVKATVIEVKENGRYLLQTSDNTKFYITSAEPLKKYNTVMVNVPKGDWSEEKTLISVVTTKQEEELKKHINFLNSMNLTSASGIKLEHQSFAIIDDKITQKFKVAETGERVTPYAGAQFDQWRFDIKFAKDIDNASINFSLKMNVSDQKEEIVIFDQDDYIGSNNFSSVFWQHIAYKSDLTQGNLNDLLNTGELTFTFTSDNENLQIAEDGLILCLGYSSPEMGWKIHNTEGKTSPFKYAGKTDFELHAEYYDGNNFYSSWDNIQQMHLLKYVSQYEPEEGYEQLDWQEIKLEGATVFKTENDATAERTYYKFVINIPSIQEDGTPKNNYFYSDAIICENESSKSTGVNISNEVTEVILTDKDGGHYYYEADGSFNFSELEKEHLITATLSNLELQGKQKHFSWNAPDYSFNQNDVTTYKESVIGADGDEILIDTLGIEISKVTEPLSTFLPVLIKMKAKVSDKYVECYKVKKNEKDGYQLLYRGKDKNGNWTDKFFYRLNKRGYLGQSERITCTVQIGTPSDNTFYSNSCYLRFSPRNSNALSYRLEIGYEDPTVTSLVRGTEEKVRIKSKLYDVVNGKELEGQEFSWSLVKAPPLNSNRDGYYYDVKFSYSEQDEETIPLEHYNKNNDKVSYGIVKNFWYENSSKEQVEYKGNFIDVTPPQTKLGYGTNEIWNYILKVSTCINIAENEIRNLTEYFPLAVAKSKGSYVQGPDRIIFSYSGETSYQNTPYQYFNSVSKKMTDWGLLYQNAQDWVVDKMHTTNPYRDIEFSENSTVVSAYLKLPAETSTIRKGQQEIFSIAVWDGGATGTQGNSPDNMVYMQPVLIDFNSWGENTYLDAWEGSSLELDEEDGVIFTPYLASGTKDKENKFTGVILGQAEGVTTHNKTWGLFGQQKGLPRFEFTENGTAYIGDANGNYLQFANGNFSIVTKNFSLETESLKIYSGTRKVDNNNIEEGRSIISGKKTDEKNYVQRLKLGYLRTENNKDIHGLELYGNSTIAIYNTGKTEGKTLSAEQKIFWVDDEGTLHIKGSIESSTLTIKEGTIGGFYATKEYLMSSTNQEHGMDCKPGSAYAFWAGYKIEDDKTLLDPRCSGYNYRITGFGQTVIDDNFLIGYLASPFDLETYLFYGLGYKSQNNTLLNERYYRVDTGAAYLSIGAWKDLSSGSSDKYSTSMITMVSDTIVLQSVNPSSPCVFDYGNKRYGFSGNVFQRGDSVNSWHFIMHSDNIDEVYIENSYVYFFWGENLLGKVALSK